MESQKFEHRETTETPKEKVESIIKTIEIKTKQLLPRVEKEKKNSLRTCHYKEKNDILRFYREQNTALQQARQEYMESFSSGNEHPDQVLLTQINATLQDRRITDVFDTVDNPENLEYTTIRNANQLQKDMDSSGFIGEMRIDVQKLNSATGIQPALIQNDIADGIKFVDSEIHSDATGFTCIFKKIFEDRNKKSEQIKYTYATADGKFKVHNQKGKNEAILDQGTVDYLTSRIGQCKIMRNNGRGAVDNNVPEEDPTDRLKSQVSGMG